jgi:hypothetical protein
MRNISEAEALALLAKPLTCEDCTEWQPIKANPSAVKISNGLINAEGVGTGLFVELVFHRGITTRLITFKFSVFRLSSTGSERIYQLHVSQFPKIQKNQHALSHEHIGASRVLGDAKWQKWMYDDVMAYFCKKTSITFIPPCKDPDLFELKP